jgi:hypothetical protein
MGKLIPFPVARPLRRVCSHVVTYDSPRAAALYGEEFRQQRQFCWSREEAEDFASKNSLNGGPPRVDPL